MDSRIVSEEILMTLKYLDKEGNKIREVSMGWSEMKIVVVMEKKITNEQREEIATKFPELKYFSWKGNPWEPASENFYSDEDREAILFPLDDPNPW